MNYIFLLLICGVFATGFENDHFHLETSFEDNLMTASEIQIADKANVPKSSSNFSPDQDPRLFKTRTAHEKLNFGEQVGEKINLLAYAMLDRNDDKPAPSPPVESPTSPSATTIVCTVLNILGSSICQYTSTECFTDIECITTWVPLNDRKVGDTSVNEQLSLILPTTVAKLHIVSAMNFT